MNNPLRKTRSHPPLPPPPKYPNSGRGTGLANQANRMSSPETADANQHYLTMSGGVVESEYVIPDIVESEYVIPDIVESEYVSTDKKPYDGIYENPSIGLLHINPSDELIKPPPVPKRRERNDLYDNNIHVSSNKSNHVVPSFPPPPPRPTILLPSQPMAGINGTITSSNFEEKSVDEMSIHEIVKSLQNVGLKNVASIVESEEFDGHLMSKFSEDDLRVEPFCLSGLHLKKTLLFIKGWRPNKGCHSESVNDMENFTMDALHQYLMDNRLAQLADILQLEQVDGKLFLSLYEDDFMEKPIGLMGPRLRKAMALKKGHIINRN